MKVAILIAVEQFSDPAIGAVKYARADATELAAALLPHGFEEADRILLIDADATKTIIESRVRRTVNGLSQDDTLLFFYAGHGFSKNGENYLTCHDTQLDDLESTSIELESLLERFRACSAERIVMFLDACESEVLASVEMGGEYSELANDKLADFFSQSEYGACFSACETGETSWPSNILRHRVWTHHVIEAFQGNAPLALKQGSLLTSASLQNHLGVAVPRSLREAFSDKKVQTPWMSGSQNNEVLLADVSEVLENNRGATNPDSDQIARMTLFSEKVMHVRQLSGFKSSHRIPDSYTASTQSFVGSLASDDVRKELNTMLASLRSAFGFKRVELQSSFTDDAHAIIITPYFNYTVDVEQSETEVTEVTWRREVNEIKEPNQILTGEFETVFRKAFNTIEFSLPTLVDIATFIDRVEQVDDQQLSIDYDAELSWCSLSIKGEEARIYVTPSTMQIVRNQPAPPKVLIKLFFHIQRALIDTHDIRAIEFKGK